MRRISRRESFKLAAGVAVAGSVMGRPARAALDKVVFGTVPYISSGPLFIAQAKGYFEKVGIELEPTFFVDGGLAMPALAAGEIDISVTPCTVGFFNMVAKGTPVRIFMDRGRESAGRASQSIMVSNQMYESGFTNLAAFKDAKGKIISEAVPGSIGHYLVSKAYLKAGLKHDDGEWKWGLDGPSALQLMAANKIDITEVPMPSAMAASKKGIGKIIAWGDEIAPDMQLATVASSEKWLSEKKDVAIRYCMVMLQAYREFMAAADDGNKEIIAILAKATELPDAMIDEARPRWSAMALDGIPNKDAILSQQAYWHDEIGLLERLADPEKLFDLTAVTEARAALEAKNPFL